MHGGMGRRWGAHWGHMGAHGAPIGRPWVPMGRPWGAHGCPWGAHGEPMGSWGMSYCARPSRNRSRTEMAASESEHPDCNLATRLFGFVPEPECLVVPEGE